MVRVPQDKEQKDFKLLVVSSKGMGKKTDLSEYKKQNRGGSGILTYKVSDKTGDLIAARMINTTVENDIIIATRTGKFIRLDEEQLPTLGRATQGVKLIRLNDGDGVTSVAVVSENEEE